MKRPQAVFLTMFALASSSTFTASAQDPAPQPGGDVTVSIVAEPPGWDPTVSTSQEIARVMYHNVFEGLVRIDRSGDPCRLRRRSRRTEPRTAGRDAQRRDDHM